MSSLTRKESNLEYSSKFFDVDIDDTKLNSLGSLGNKNELLNSDSDTKDSYTSNNCLLLNPSRHSSSKSQGASLEVQNSICDEYSLVEKKQIDKIRSSYLAKLDLKNSKNNKVYKAHNSIIIFDWDDTLICSTYLNSTGAIDDNVTVTGKNKEKIQTLDETVFNLLSQSITLGETYIVTNAEPGWVEYSSKKFYPKTDLLLQLKKIKIVSARGHFEKMYPGDNKQWKVQAFLDLLKTVDTNLVANLICLGDSTIEMDAAHILASKFSQAYIKTVKFKESPKPNELIKQLKIVSEQFNKIYYTIRNLTIRVQKNFK